MKNPKLIPDQLIQKCEDLICWATQSESVLDAFGRAIDANDADTVVDILERCLGRRNAKPLQAQRGTRTQRAAAEEVIQLMNVSEKSR